MRRTRSDSDDEVGPAPAFTITTMSGRGVKISGAAIDRASQLFDYELPEGFCEGFSFAGLSIGDAADNDEAPDEAEIEALGEAEILVSTPSVADRHLPPPPRAARAHDEAETLVSTLKTSLAAKDDVAKSLARVRNILQDATDAPTGLLERGVAAGIVSVMQRFAHSNDVLIEACGTIDDLAVFDEAHEFLADAGVAGAICRIVSCLAVTVQDVDASPENEKHDELLPELLGEDRPFAYLSGPSFAAEIVQGMATAVTVASVRAHRAHRAIRATRPTVGTAEGALTTLTRRLTVTWRWI